MPNKWCLSCEALTQAQKDSTLSAPWYPCSKTFTKNVLPRACPNRRRKEKLSPRLCFTASAHSFTAKQSAAILQTQPQIAGPGQQMVLKQTSKRLHPITYTQLSALETSSRVSSKAMQAPVTCSIGQDSKIWSWIIVVITALLDA